MREDPRLGLGLREQSPDDEAPQKDSSAPPVELGGNWFFTRVILGAALGALIGYVTAGMIAKPEAAGDLAFWGGFVGWWLGFVVTVDIRDGRLFFDRAAFSATWGHEGWVRGKASIAEHSSIFIIVGFACLVCGFVIAWVDDRLDPLLISVFGGFFLALGLWSMNERTRARLVGNRQMLGRPLMILGTGILVLCLPNVLRYIAQPRARLDSEPLFLAIAAMMIAGGWLLSKTPRR